MRVFSGSYTGNGTDNRAITGVPFQPTTVIVKAVDQGYSAYMRTDDMATYLADPAYSLSLRDDTGGQAGRIKSITSTGFTIGTDAAVNQTGTSYVYVAMADPSKTEYISVGYTGNDASSQTVSFPPPTWNVTPSFVMLKHDDTITGAFRFSSQPNNLSSVFYSSGNQADVIKSFTSDGFNVGNGGANFVNRNGKWAFGYMIEAVSGRQVISSYVGDGTSSRTISLGFQPEMVLIRQDDGNQPLFKLASHPSTSSQSFDGVAVTNGITGITATGFTVSNNSASNTSGKTYYYLAIADYSNPVPPVANFTASNTAPYTNQAITFTDTSTGSPTSWAWDFGDSTTSTVQNPTKTYTTPGTYTVTLTATNAQGSDGETKTGYITVTAPPPGAILVQSKTATTTTNYVNSTTISSTSAVTTGNMLVLTIASTATTANDISGVTDNRGNTWTKATSYLANARQVDVWYATNVAAGATTVTVASTNFTQKGLALVEFSGMPSTATLGTIATQADSAYVTEHTITVAGTNSLVIAAYAGSNGASTYTGTNALTSGGDSTNLGMLSDLDGATSLTITGTQFEQGALVAVPFALSSTPSAPATPTGLAGVPGDGTATLSWNASTGATSYTLKRSTSSGGTYTDIYTGANLTYTDTGRTNGTPYYYKVSATNTNGTSADSSVVSVTPAVPPSVVTKDWHPYGVQPNMTVAALRALARAKYDAWFGYTLTTDGMPSGMTAGAKRIKVPDQGFYNNPDFNGTVSEGIGYGMLLKAWFSNPALGVGIYDANAKADFDALYKYYEYYKNVRGLMHWNITYQGVVADQNGATDGDLDAAMGLVIMARLHGATGGFDYAAEATELINNIRDYEFVPATGVPGTGAYPNIITNGDGWGFATNNLMPDYFRPGFLREFYYHTNDSRWLDIVTANYVYCLQHYYNTYAGGVVPDRQTREHTSIDAVGNPQWDLATYNSVRLGFGIMYDYLWNGPTAPVLGINMMNKMADKAKANFTTGGAVKAPNYNLDFSTWESYSNLSGYGMVGPPSLGKLANQTFATEILTAMDSSTEWATSYFNGGVGLMGLVAMSGIGQNYRSVGPSIKRFNGTTWVDVIRTKI